MTFRRRSLLIAGMVIVGAYLVIGILGPWLAPHPYAEQDTSNALLPPFSGEHLLGTDAFGRDTLSRLLVGARTSLFVAGGVTVVAMAAGLLLGTVSGFFGGRIDAFIRGLIDLVWSFPNVLVAIILVAVMGPGVTPVMIAIGLTNGIGFARVVRGDVLSLRQRDFVRAATTLGRTRAYIIARHIVPNVLGSLFIMASFYVGIAVLIESAFAFIGLGAQPPTPSWGVMIADGREYMQLSPWQVLLPGSAIAVTVIGFNLLGDELRDMVDPRMRDGV